MFEKIYKSAVVVLAVVIIAAVSYLALKPDIAEAQIPAPPVLIPSDALLPSTDSHVWVVTASMSNSTYGFILHNKQTGEAYYLDQEQSKKLR